MKQPFKNILFYGTDTLSTAVLSKVHQHGYNVSAVTKHTKSPVHQYCQQHGIPVETFRKSVLPFGRSPAAFSEHLGIVASFGHMIPSRVIRSTSLGFVNIHPSLIPKYQGAAPLPHTLLNGDKKYGVTVLEALPRSFDTGKILHQTQFNIPTSLSGAEFWDHTAHNMAEVTWQFLQNPAHSAPRIQDKDMSSPAPRLSKQQMKSLARVCPQVQTADQIFNISRCLDLYDISVVVCWQAKALKLMSVTPITDPHVVELVRTRLKTGQFVYWDGLLAVKCAEDTVLGVSRMVLPFKPVISAHQFYRNNCNSGVEKVFRMVYTPSYVDSLNTQTIR